MSSDVSTVDNLHLYMWGYILVGIMHILYRRIPNFNEWLGMTYIGMFVLAIGLMRHTGVHKGHELYIFGYLVIGIVHCLHSRFEQYERVVGLTYLVMFAVSSSIFMMKRKNQ